MAAERKLTFYHAPNSRSSGVLALLEELGAPYTLSLLNLKEKDQHKPAYKSINPMGKVPAIMHGDALVTEQAAIYIYLADSFPKAGIAPGLLDPRRGPYLRWIAFYAGCVEPACVDHAMKREPAAYSTSPYGDYATVVKTVEERLAHNDFIATDTFSAADVLWGSALGWLTQFNLFPKSVRVVEYIDRIKARPAIARAAQKDAELAQDASEKKKA